MGRRGGGRSVIYGFARRRETRDGGTKRVAKWKREKDIMPGGGERERKRERESTCACTQHTRVRECKHATPRAGRWKWATGEVKAGRWRRSLQFSARRPLDRSNANNVVDANCR